MENKPTNSLQKPGGIAALLHAAAYLLGMAIGIVFIFPVLMTAPERYLDFLASNQALVYLWNLVAYWGSAVTLIVMALALYERVKSGSPGLGLVASAFGLIWAGLIIASGNLMLADAGTIARLYAQDPLQAGALWTALQAVENGIASSNELTGSLWVLLISLAALRSKALPGGLNLLGIALGAAGLLTVIPAIALGVGMVFGLGMVVWSTWLGIALLRRSPLAAAERPGRREPASLPV